jgi:hypothetical protein
VRVGSGRPAMAADTRCDLGADSEYLPRRERAGASGLQQCGSSIRRGLLKGESCQEIRRAEMMERPELSLKFLPGKLLLRRDHVTGTPLPLRCGRARYNISRIMRICGLPSIKYFFLKGLSVNMSCARS